MKKVLLTILLLSVGFTYATAQDSTATAHVKEDATIATPDYCGFTPVTHWSFGLKAGGNYFRVAPEPISKYDQIHFIFGGMVEFTINPIVGIGIEYAYNPYFRPYRVVDYANDTTTYGDIEGGTHDLMLYGAFNLSNMFTPHRQGKAQRWNVYAITGVGYGLYRNSLDINEPEGNFLGPLGNLGLNIEYNLSRALSVDLEGQYRYYHRKLVSSNIYNEKSNALNVTLGLRYKLNATGDKQHARNIRMCEYYPKPEPVVIEKIVKCDTTGTAARLKALEDEVKALNEKIKKLCEEKAANTGNQSNNMDNNFRNNSDGNTNSSNLGDSGNVRNTLAAGGNDEVASWNIEFEFDSDKLKASSFPTLNEIADILKENPVSVKLRVTGHTDYIGTEEYNQELSIRRANSVRNYLIRKGVSAANISIIGCGETKPIAPNETPDGRQKNRRVEFKIGM